MTDEPFSLSNIKSELAAVNACLSSIGEQPVNSLAQSQSSDVALARGIINEVMLGVQGRGWSWNREYALPITPDADGNIFLPVNTMRVDVAYASEDAARYAVTQRGSRLYDLRGHTFAFPATVTVDLVSLIPFEDLPAAASAYIATASVQLFQARQQGSSLVFRVGQDQATAALALLEQNEDEVTDFDSIHGNADVMQALNGTGLRRNRQG